MTELCCVWGSSGSTPFVAAGNIVAWPLNKNLHGSAVKAELFIFVPQHSGEKRRVYALQQRADVLCSALPISMLICSVFIQTLTNSICSVPPLWNLSRRQSDRSDHRIFDVFAAACEKGRQVFRWSRSLFSGEHCCAVCLPVEHAAMPGRHEPPMAIAPACSWPLPKLQTSGMLLPALAAGSRNFPATAAACRVSDNVDQTAISVDGGKSSRLRPACSAQLRHTQQPQQHGRQPATFSLCMRTYICEKSTLVNMGRREKQPL